MVVIGCPHASLDQLRDAAARAAGRRASADLRFYIHTSRSTLDAAETEGVAGALRDAGITVTADSCSIVSYERMAPGTRLATNSTKMALFAKSVAKAEILFGSAAQCIAAGLTGRWGA